MQDQIPSKAEKTVQSATFTFTLDKDYRVTLYKTINGSTSYSVEVLEESCEVAVRIVTETILKICEKHGAFNPPKSD